MNKAAYLKLCLTIFAWGGVYHTGNFLVRYMDPITVSFTRYLIASIILLVILKQKRGQLIDVQQFKQHWLLLMCVGIFGIGLYNLAFFGAEKYISANMIAIIFSVSPCITAFIASFVFKQKVGALGYLGMFVALAGTFGVINFTTPSCKQYFCPNILAHLSKGQIYAICMCLLSATFSILNKKATMKNIDSLTITTFASVFGTILLFICTLTSGDLTHILSFKPISFWAALLYTSIIGSVAGYFWFSEAISQLGVGRVVVFLNGIPFATVLIGVVLLGKPISFDVIICGTVIITGVLITNFAANRNN